MTRSVSALVVSLFMFGGGLHAAKPLNVDLAPTILAAAGIAAPP